MLAGHCLLALASATLPISVGLGFASPWLIVGLGFLAGCGFALNDPAWHASVGDLLEKRDIPPAVTLMSVGFNIVRSAGPALGGVIIALFGPLAAFSLAAVSDLGSSCRHHPQQVARSLLFAPARAHRHGHS